MEREGLHAGDRWRHREAIVRAHISLASILDVLLDIELGARFGILLGAARHRTHQEHLFGLALLSMIAGHRQGLLLLLGVSRLRRSSLVRFSSRVGRCLLLHAGACSLFD